MYEQELRTKVSKQPSLYPPLAFHLIRTGQILSSAIVLSILSFFIHYLHLENYPVPWTFILVRTPNRLRFWRQILIWSSATAPYCIRHNHLLSHRDGNPP